MAITRSRTVPKVVKKEQLDHEVDQKKVAEKEVKKVTKGVKNSKPSNIKINKINKSTTRNIPKRAVQRKLRKEGYTEVSTVDSDNNHDSHSKKLPAYKIEQLQRLQRLINMSEVAKPRGPITSNDIRTKTSNDVTSVNILLDKSNKNKISNVTSYNPIRQKLLENKLTAEEKRIIVEKYEKNLKYKNVKVPKLSDDLILKEVLNEISNKNKELKFWNHCDKQFENNEFGNQKLLKNEKILNLHEINEVQRDNLMHQKLNNVQSTYSNNDCLDKQKEFRKIDINRVTRHTDLNNMLKYLDSNLETKVNEDTAFDGLKVEDYTTVRKFGNSKV